MIIWIILGIVYLCIALVFIRNWSYRCCMAMYGIYEYTPLTILMGLFFPITIFIYFLMWLFGSSDGGYLY